MFLCNRGLFYLTGFLPPACGPSTFDPVKALVGASIARSTLTNYNRAWSRFRSFWACRGPFNGVPYPHVVAAFAAHLSGAGLGYRSVRAHTCAISFVAKLNNCLDPCSSFIVKKVLDGISRSCAPAASREPITRAMLPALVLAACNVFQDSYKILWVHAMFLFAFYGFCRVSELTASRHTFLFQNVSFSPALDGVTLRFETFKHGKHPEVISVRALGTEPQLCLVRSLLAYVQARGTQGGLLFVHPTGLPVRSSEFALWLTRCARVAGFGHLKLTPHCFRIGAATQAASNGLSIDQVARLGRWHSGAVKGYIKCVPVW